MALNSWGAGKPPPEPPPKNPPPMGGGGFSPPPPPVFPSFPKPVQGGGQGGGGEEPPHIIYSPPPPPPMPHIPEPVKIVKKKPVLVEPPHVRPPLFITHVERVYRSNVFFNTNDQGAAVLNAPGAVTEAILGLETFLRESQNDAFAAKHEYEADKLKVEVQKQIHSMNERLYEKAVLTKQGYEESVAKMKKTLLRVDESKARWEEFEAEVSINQWKLAQAKGQSVALIDKAKSYVTLWEARLAKVKAAEGEAKATFDYFTIVYDMTYRLWQAKAAAREEVLQVQKELDEATVVWKLAKVLVEQNTKYVEEAKASVRSVEKGELLPL